MIRTLVRLGLLACAGAVMQLGWLVIWTLSYRLTHGNDFTYTYLMTQSGVWEKLHALLVLANVLVPGLEGPDGARSLEALVNTLVIGFVITGVGYLAGILLVDLGVAAVRGALLVILLFEAFFQITLFLLPGLYTTDVFSYMVYSQISASYGLNPYVFPPNYFPNNALLNGAWIHPIWWDQPSVYGPLWTGIGWIVGRVLMPLDGLAAVVADGQVLPVGLMYEVFAYKLLLNAVHVVNLALVWWLLGRVMAHRPRARLTAFVLFAWNPLMLFDAAGNAHNDALMVTLLLLGVVPLVGRRGQRTNINWLCGTFLVGLSALIKYTTGLVAVFYVVPWARRLPTLRARVLWIGGAAGAVALATLGLYMPWLDFPRALSPIIVAATGKSWMYSNWAPDLLAMVLVDHVLDPNSRPPELALDQVRTSLKTIARAVFAGYVVWEVVSLWRLAGDRSRDLLEPILETSARAFVVLIMLVLTWVLEWYWMWPLALVTLLGWHRMLTRVVVAYTLTSLPVFYVHHYWSTNMPPLLVLAYALPPLVLPLVSLAYARWRRRPVTRTPVNQVLIPGLGAATE